MKLSIVAGWRGWMVEGSNRSVLEPNQGKIKSSARTLYLLEFVYDPPIKRTQGLFFTLNWSKYHV